MSITEAKDQESWLKGFAEGSKATKLLDCPFCGCEAILMLQIDLDSEPSPWYKVKCSNCYRVETDGYTDVEKVTAAWNDRFKEEEK